jgi:hypothetical protein
VDLPETRKDTSRKMEKEAEKSQTAKNSHNSRLLTRPEGRKTKCTKCLKNFIWRL